MKKLLISSLSLVALVVFSSSIVSCSADTCDMNKNYYCKKSDGYEMPVACVRSNSGYFGGTEFQENDCASYPYEK